MEFTLNPDKIKSISYLTNKILEREESFNTPKHCFLLGAGCSVTSDIPTGYGVMEICRRISFLSNHEDGYKVNKCKSSFIKFLEDVESFILDHKSSYEQYIIDKEKYFKSRINDSKVISRIPSDLKVQLSKEYALKDEELDNKLFEDFIDRFHNDSLYGKWFEEYSQDTRERQKLIENIIENSVPGGEYILFANLIDQGLINNVFTTNFDDLLNEALLSFTNRKSRVFSHNETAKYISIGSKKPNIIKLHGDYLYENIKNSNEETHELESNMKAKFAEALNVLDMIVVGYGGSDYSIMSVLESIKKQGRTFGLLWCSKSPKNLHWRVINLINTTSNSFFIQVDDFETLVFKIWGISNNIVKNLIQDASEKQAKLDIFLNKYKKSIEGNNNISNKEKEAFDKSLKANEIFNLALNEPDYNKQIELYSKSLEFNPNNHAALNNRGVAYLDIHKHKGLYNFQKAIDDYTKAIKLNPNNSLYLSNRAKTLAELGEIEKAFEDANKAFELDKTNPQVYEALGIIYIKIKNYDLAIENLSKAIDLDPNSSISYFNRGLAYGEKGKNDLAIQDYEQSIKLGHKDLFHLYNNMAVVYRRLGQFEKAIELINKSLDINPDYSYSYGTLALIYSDLKNHSKFYEYLEIALQKKCPVWNFISDPSLNRYAHESKYKYLILKYKN